MRTLVSTVFFVFILSSLQAQEMVFVKGGDYTTSLGEKVTIKDFYIDVNEVTILDFSKFVKSTGYKTVAEVVGKATITGGVVKENVNWRYDVNGKIVSEEKWGVIPVVFLTIKDILEYCKWAKRRLPTEAEWEYAFREGRNSNYKYSGSNSARKVAWSDEKDIIYSLQPVRTKKPNALGIYDMSGNTNEWTTKGDLVVFKGGGFIDDLSRFTYKARKAIKLSRILDDKEPSWYVGFRTAKDVK